MASCNKRNPGPIYLEDVSGVECGVLQGGSGTKLTPSESQLLAVTLGKGLTAVGLKFLLYWVGTCTHSPLKRLHRGLLIMTMMTVASTHRALTVCQVVF